MDNLNNNLISKRNILVFLFLAIIAVAIPVSLKLVQNQTQLKSKATEGLNCNPGDGINICQTSCPAGTTGSCGGHTYCVYNPSGNTESACQCETASQNCVPSSGTSGGGTCNITNQSPALSDTCVSCIKTKNTSAISYIKSQDPAHATCSDAQIINFWCNGGVGSQASNECAGYQSGVCASACGKTSSDGGNCSAGATYTISGTVKDSNGNLVNSGVVCLDPAGGSDRNVCPAISTGRAVNITNGTFTITNVNPVTSGHGVYVDLKDNNALNPASAKIVGQNATCTNQTVDFTVQKNLGRPSTDSCPTSGAGTKTTCGFTTYDSCVDNKGQTSNNLCVNNTAGNFRCYLHEETTDNRCISGTSVSDFNYPCSACSPNSCAPGTTYTISGKVTNNGQPLSGITICSDPSASGCNANSTGKATTDSSGSYTISGLVAGGQGHNIYLDPSSLPAGVTIPNNNQPINKDVCSNTSGINFTLSFNNTQLKTKCYILSEDTGAVNSVTSCNDHLAVAWTGAVTLPRTFAASTTSVTKTFSVKFINTAGVSSPVTTKSITYNPNAAPASTAPTITNVSCQQNLITITGTNFGNQGTGKVTANGQPTTIGTWNSASNTITATPTQLLSGDISIQLTTGNNQTVSGQCTVNTTTVAFTAVNSCRQPEDFAADNVSVKIYDATSTDANVAPLIDQTISLDKKGKPVNFAPKLAQGKPYTLIVKAPNTVARAKTFTPIGGTFNLPVIILPAGDIYPIVAPDGVINQFDLNELKHQWAVGVDVRRLADLNGDSRVNSIDYSCAINNNTLKDDVFIPATLPTAGQNTPTQVAKTIQLNGRVFADSNSNGIFDSGERLISGATVKILQEPNSHTIGQPLTTAERNASVLLGQTVTDANGNYSLTATVPANTLWIAAFVDAGTVANLGGGQYDIGFGALPSSQQSFTFNNNDIPLASSPANIIMANSGITGSAPSSTVTPVINTITPANGLISTAITITGANFGANTGTINFYAAAATSPTASAGINSWTSTQINATIPGALSPSTQYSLEVITGSGDKSSKTNYFVGP